MPIVKRSLSASFECTRFGRAGGAAGTQRDIARSFRTEGAGRRLRSDRITDRRFEVRLRSGRGPIRSGLMPLFARQEKAYGRVEMQERHR